MLSSSCVTMTLILLEPTAWTRTSCKNLCSATWASCTLQCSHWRTKILRHQFAVLSILRSSVSKLTMVPAARRMFLWCCNSWMCCFPSALCWQLTLRSSYWVMPEAAFWFKVSHWSFSHLGTCLTKFSVRNKIKSMTCHLHCCYSNSIFVTKNININNWSLPIYLLLPIFVSLIWLICFVYGFVVFTKFLCLQQATLNYNYSYTYLSTLLYNIYTT